MPGNKNKVSCEGVYLNVRPIAPCLEFVEDKLSWPSCENKKEPDVFFATAWCHRD